MPRVSEAYREARRHEIAQAALVCLARNGVHNTTIADIVAESGLSTGAIYSHFADKGEIARYIAERYLFTRADGLEEAAANGTLLAPREVLLTLLTAVQERPIPGSVILQFWAESTVDEGLRVAVGKVAERIGDIFVRALMPWALRGTDSGAEATALATSSARTLIALAQGYITSSTVLGPRDPVEYLDSVTVLLCPTPAP